MRFTRRLPHSPDKVWRAVTEAEHLEAWFPHQIVGEWVVGAPLRFVSQFGDFDGEVVAFQPPSWAPGERWRELNGSYVERFGPQAATIGPPEDGEEKVLAR
ncbi:MAG: hypothetical protein E6J14_07215 [Chloroflexi bacterium]|nr:MAG: hypothetical protein E6J14_07215 [Chloroflexota bacterium]